MNSVAAVSRALRGVNASFAPEAPSSGDFMFNSMRSRAGYCRRLIYAATNFCDRPQFAHLGSAYFTSNVAPFRALSYRRLSYGIVQAEMAVQPFKRRPPKFQVQQTGHAIKGTVEKVTFSNEENGW